MLLVIDVGNTQTVIGIYENDNLRASWRMSTDIKRTADETWVIFSMWCMDRNIAVSRIKGTVISSVVPSLIKVFTDLSENNLHLKPLIVNAETAGLAIAYEPPGAVGADRICNAVAAFQDYGGPAVVVDFGTATTFDVISTDGTYMGGIIALGLNGASSELHRLSAVLPRVALNFPKHVIGTSTEKSMQSGILWGTVAMIDGLAARVAEELGSKNTAVIATGGIAPLFEGRSGKITVVDPFLTLKGMKYIWKRQMIRS